MRSADAVGDASLGAILPDLLRQNRSLVASLVAVLSALTLAVAARMALNVVMGPTAKKKGI